MHEERRYGREAARELATIAAMGAATYFLVIGPGLGMILGAHVLLDAGAPFSEVVWSAHDTARTIGATTWGIAFAVLAWAIHTQPRGRRHA